MKRMLITGSSGYIGKAFIDTFGSTYSLRLFGRTCPQGDHEFVQGNVKNIDDVIKASSGVDTILHLAAVTTDTKGINDSAYFETNTLGTLNVLKAAVENKVKKIVYASSVCAVGFREAPELIKETSRCEPSDGMYGYSKYLSERLCEFYAKKYDLKIICLRFAMILPQHKFVVPARAYMPYSMGVVHIDDVIQALNLAVENETINYGVYHVAADSPYSKFDIKKARRELSFNPKHDFSELIKPGCCSKIINALVRLVLHVKKLNKRKQ